MLTYALDQYTLNPQFQPEIVGAVSRAAKSLCMWCRAIGTSKARKLGTSKASKLKALCMRCLPIDATSSTSSLRPHTLVA